jgi:signal peptidase I
LSPGILAHVEELEADIAALRAGRGCQDVSAEHINAAPWPVGGTRLQGHGARPCRLNQVQAEAPTLTASSHALPRGISVGEESGPFTRPSELLTSYRVGPIRGSSVPRSRPGISLTLTCPPLFVVVDALAGLGGEASGVKVTGRQAGPGDGPHLFRTPIPWSGSAAVRRRGALQGGQDRGQVRPVTATANEVRPRGRSFFARGIRELVIILVAAGLIAFLLKTLVGQLFFIPSTSMLPQLEVDDRVMVSKLSYRLHPPRRGDIVVFDCPPLRCPGDKKESGLLLRALRGVGEAVGVIQPSTEDFIKRVVALPGETIEVRGGVVYINGLRLVEPYLPSGAFTADLAPTTVPARHLYVLGDHRVNSADSRFFGPISQSSIVGRAVIRVWPLAKASFL